MNPDDVACLQKLYETFPGTTFWKDESTSFLMDTQQGFTVRLTGRPGNHGWEITLKSGPVIHATKYTDTIAEAKANIQQEVKSRLQPSIDAQVMPSAVTSEMASQLCSIRARSRRSAPPDASSGQRRSLMAGCPRRRMVREFDTQLLRGQGKTTQATKFPGFCADAERDRKTGTGWSPTGRSSHLGGVATGDYSVLLIGDRSSRRHRDGASGGQSPMCCRFGAGRGSQGMADG
jgi:hypothetical protein